jgi:hypothetical protein
MIHGKLRRSAPVAFALLLTAGCAEQRIDNAGRLADAGVAFADSVPAVIDESFVLAVTADSLTIAKARENLAQADRLETLKTSDDALTARLAILLDLKHHAQLLRSYFIALGALAKSDAATGITGSTQNIVAKLSDLGLKIGDETIGPAKISDLIEPAVKFAVAAYQNIALRRELEERGPAIERELALQQAVLAALTDQMMADKALQIRVENRNPLVLQYAGAGALPSDWNARRIAAFRQTINLQSLDVAGKAADNLHQSWIAFAEDRLDEASFQRLLKDIDDLLAEAEKLRANS